MEEGARRVADDFQQNKDVDLIQKDPQVAEARPNVEKRAQKPVQVAQSYDFSNYFTNTSTKPQQLSAAIRKTPIDVDNSIYNQPC